MNPIDLTLARAALSAWDDPCSHDVVEERSPGSRTWHSCRLAADHDGLHHWQPPALAEHLRAALAEVDRLTAILAAR